MTPKAHLIDRLKLLCRTNGGPELVADAAGVSADNLKQIIAGTPLPSGAPRGVGPSVQAKLDNVYPGWSGLGAHSTASQPNETRSLAAALQQAALFFSSLDETTRDVIASVLPRLAHRPDSAAEVAALISRLASTQSSPVDAGLAASPAAPTEQPQPSRLVAQPSSDDRRRQSSRYIGQERNRPASKPQKQSSKK